MKVFECIQGTTRWCMLRAGRPTASSFDRIITPTGKASGQAEAYMYELLAELMMGRPIEGVKMPWMERGSMLEADAAAWYELQRDVEAVPVGFCTTDDERIGASPDRLVGDDGLLELKCPSPGTHLQYLLFPKRGVDKAYRPQVQGQLYVTGRAWTDIVSYHPELPSVIVRVERDEEYIALLAAGLKTFCDQLDLARADLEREYGPLKGRQDPESEAGSADFLTDEDVQAILAARGLSNGPSLVPGQPVSVAQI